MYRIVATSLGALLVLAAGCGSASMGGASAHSSGEPVSGDAPAQSGQAGSPASASTSSSAGKGGSGGSGASTKPSSGSSSGGAGASAPMSRKDPNEKLSADTDFVSADDVSSTRNASTAQRSEASTGAAPAAPATASDAAKSGDPRSVERGDIYRVLGDQRILNLNSYRGVQILDVSDLSHPRVEGRLAVAGDPVELYVVEDRAIVLLNNWQGYYGARDDVKVERVNGGLVLSVDIKDRAHPTLIDQTPVPGSISTSRLTQGGGQAALYVAAMSYDGNQQAVIKSFDVSAGKLTPKTELSLGGYVQDIQATTDVLMVASNDYTKNQGRSQVSVVDISRPDGSMTRGGTVLAQGIVQNKFNMDAYNGVLRVASGANFNGALRNHLETFSLKDLQKLTPIDDCIFGQRDPQSGQSEMLYATVFVENRGFFVTYYRKDPFHAFSFDDSGHCQEHTQFVVSGWNDFLRPTLKDTRLIGIGHNDQNNTRTLSVSLYDAVNLDNANPLKARADIDLNGSYSEATWDDRGFGVLDDAVSVKASDGTSETGLVLLPFEGWDATKQASVAQVQIFTFSDHTLTKRGTMDHGSSVRRSFEVKDDTTGNLSEDQLSLFDTGNPDAPKELGRVDLAPNYSRVFVYGDYVARVREPNASSYPIVAAQPNQTQPKPKATVQVLKHDSDVDSGDVVTSFEIPGGSDLTQVGNLLVSVVTTVTYDNAGNNPPKYHSAIQVYDLTDPSKPHARGSLETDRLEPGSYGGIVPLRGGIAVDSCFDCIRPPYPYGGGAQHFTVGDAIAFVHTTSQQKSIGQVTQCYINPPSNACTSDRNGNLDCGTPYYVGGMTCTTPKGGQQTCEGQFLSCDKQGNNCKPVDQPPGTTSSCNNFEQFRYWTSYAFDTLDLRNPDAPVLTDRLELPQDEEGNSVIAADKTLYFNFAKPFSKKSDSHAYVKRYVRLIDFRDPGKPSAGDGINVPGDVIEADGTTLYTRDFVWNNNDRRTLVGRVVLSGNLAHLQASKLFADRSVTAATRDGVGHVLVSSDPAYVTGPVAVAAPSGGAASATEPPKSKLSMLDDQSLDTLGEADVDSWATFKSAQHGRALYQVAGGLLVFDVEDAAHPKAQAYFPTMGWPSEILFDGQSILFAAGQYGVYRFDASVFNLLMK